MPIPTSISDLSQTAADNYPTGAEVIGSNLDNYLRAHASFIKQAQSLASASIAAASTVDVSAADGESVLITGAATIASLGAGFVGCKRELRFDDVCTLTHSSDLQLPDATDLTTADGAVYTFRCTASGTWVYVSGVATGGGSSGGSTPVTANSNATLDGTHVNQHVEKTSASVVTLTLPPGLGSAGDAILFVNNSAANLVISRGSGVSLYRFGTNANVTLSARRSMLIVKTTTTDVWQA